MSASVLPATTAAPVLPVAALRAQLLLAASRAQALAAALPADLDAADAEVRHRVARGIGEMEGALVQTGAAAGLVRRG
jgi:hypothetical protein